MEKIETEPLLAQAFGLLAEATRNTLFDDAADLVYQTFDHPTREHVGCVYVRLVLNRIGGGGHEGAVTIH